MSTEHWNDERLDRLAATVESNARAIEALTSRQENADSRLDRSFELLETLTSRQENIDSSLDRCNNLIESNARIIQALANVAAESREEREELFQLIARQQNEIVGLRTETIRLLDLLLNQYRGDNPNS